MIRKKKGAIEWLMFEIFAPYPEFVHGIFLRHGGVSQPPFHALNASYLKDEKREHVDENVRLICEALEVPHLVRARNCHGATVAHIQSPNDYPEADGMATQHSDIALGITHADCQAALFFDPKTGAFANVHCGWRGNVQNIYLQTIEAMAHHFGSDPSDLLVGIGPSLGPSNAEFIHYQSELPSSFLPYKMGECHFNLWEISRKQLMDAGVLAYHIQIAEICTYENRHDFFSYRGERPLTGRNLTLACVKKDLH